MITDFQCNTVYFSALLQGYAPVTYANLISALDKHGVEHRLIPNTNDVWCQKGKLTKRGSLHQQVVRNIQMGAKSVSIENFSGTLNIN